MRGLLCHKLRRCRVDVHESKQRTLTFLTHKTLLCTRALTAANKVDSNFLAAKLLGETRAVAARAWVARSCDVQARDATRAGFGRVPYLTRQVRSHLIVDVLCHPKSALKARARANGTGVDVGGQGERSKPWGAGTVIRRHHFRLSPVCGSIAWAGLSQLPCLPRTPSRNRLEKL